MKTLIKLKCGISLVLQDQPTTSKEKYFFNKKPKYKSGAITSNLKRPEENHEDNIENIRYNAAIDVVESMVLSLAIAGFNIESIKFNNALQITLDAISNNYN